MVKGYAISGESSCRLALLPKLPAATCDVRSAGAAVVRD